jgi:hypothetical protein
LLRRSFRKAYRALVVLEQFCERESPAIRFWLDCFACGPERLDRSRCASAAREALSRIEPRFSQAALLLQKSNLRDDFLTSLGRAYGLAGNVDKVLYLTRQVEDGNFETAFNAFKSAGDEARTQAEESLAGGHKESARQAYLWAQNYYDSATYFADGSADPSRLEPTWELLYGCWLKSVSLFDPPIEPVSIPYENTQLHGFFFRAPNPRKEKRPLLILVNGSDGSLLDRYLWGAPSSRMHAR